MPSRNKAYCCDKGCRKSAGMRNALRVPYRWLGAAQCPLKAQLEATRREYEANAEPHVVAAVRCSIQALADTGLAAKAVKAGEMAPLFRLRCGPSGFINLSDLLERGPVVVSFFWGDWCPFCLLELKALAAAHPQIERLGARLLVLSPQASR